MIEFHIWNWRAFSSPIRQEEKGGNFKRGILSNWSELFLYCLSSRHIFLIFVWLSVVLYGLLWLHIVFSRGHRSKFIWSCQSMKVHNDSQDSLHLMHTSCQVCNAKSLPWYPMTKKKGNLHSVIASLKGCVNLTIA